MPRYENERGGGDDNNDGDGRRGGYERSGPSESKSKPETRTDEFGREIHVAAQPRSDAESSRGDDSAPPRDRERSSRDDRRRGSRDDSRRGGGDRGRDRGREDRHRGNGGGGGGGGYDSGARRKRGRDEYEDRGGRGGNGGGGGHRGPGGGGMGGGGGDDYRGGAGYKQQRRHSSGGGHGNEGYGPPRQRSPPPPPPREEEPKSVDQMLTELLLEIGNPADGPLEQTLEELSIVLKQDLGDNQTLIISLTLDCVEELPAQTPVYGTLAGLLNASNEEFGQAIVAACQERLQTALSKFENTHTRLLLRFLGELVNANTVGVSPFFCPPGLAGLADGA